MYNDYKNNKNNEYNEKRFQKPRTARLYVENYVSSTGDLWLDFIDLEEFYYYLYRGDISQKTRFYADRFVPSMILVKNFKNQKKLRKGDVVSIPMDAFIEFDYPRNREEKDLPATALASLSSESFLSALNLQTTKISRPYADYSGFKLDEDIARRLYNEWEFFPYGLETLDKNFDVIVWDVGQGNTNCITDGRNLTIFDMGCDIYKTVYEQKKILDAHKSFIDNYSRISLIISHWDLDHFNLLCNADDKFFKRICCAFVPIQAFTVTSKQIINRLLDSGCFVVGIIPPTRAARKRGNDLQEVYAGRNFTAFIGEKCSDKNKSGLALHLFGEEKSVFLPADHSNSQVWKDMYVDFQNRKRNGLSVIVPHHGGNNGNLSIPKLNCAPLKAVISVGKNHYKHPKQDVIDKYHDANFEVLRTDWERHDIDISVK